MTYDTQEGFDVYDNIGQDASGSLLESNSTFKTTPGRTASVIIESTFFGDTTLMGISDFNVANAKTVRLLIFDENGTQVFSGEVGVYLLFKA